MQSQCRSKNCNNKKDIDRMFYIKEPSRWESGDKKGEIIYGGFRGIYFCNSICWLVYKGVVENIETIKKVKCKSEPTCDKCFSFLNISPIPILYNHESRCEETYVGKAENEEGEAIKKCVHCKVFSKLTDCQLGQQEEKKKDPKPKKVEEEEWA